MWWFTFLLCAVVTYLLQYFWDSIRACYMLWKVTGPPAYPLIGTGHLFVDLHFDKNFLVFKTPAGVYVCDWGKCEIHVKWNLCKGPKVRSKARAFLCFPKMNCVWNHVWMNIERGKILQCGNKDGLFQFFFETDLCLIAQFYLHSSNVKNWSFIYLWLRQKKNIEEPNQKKVWIKDSFTCVWLRLPHVQILKSCFSVNFIEIVKLRTAKCIAKITSKMFIFCETLIKKCEFCFSA